MNMSARVFENNNSFMMDLIDAFKGVRHCEIEWVEFQLKTRKPEDVQKELSKLQYRRI